MGRTKTTANRRIAERSDDEEEDEVVIEAGKAEQGSEEKVEDQESVPHLVGASGAGMEEERDPEIEGLDEGFEEVENVVNAVMEMDAEAKEDISEMDRISDDVVREANFCEDGAIEVKNMNPNGELLADEKNSGASCLNSSSGKEQGGVAEDNLMNAEGNVIDDFQLITRTEENLDEGEPSASEFSKIIADEPLSDVVIIKYNDGGEEESKEAGDDSEHNGNNENAEVDSNVVIIEDNNDVGEKENEKGRDDFEQSGKDDVEVNKPSSLDVSFGNARSAEGIAVTPMHRPGDRVLLQVKTVCLQRLPKSWDVEKIKETCKQYGVIKRFELFRNFYKKGNDVGFVAFTTRESAVACVEGFNKEQFGEYNVKADIMRPFVGGRLRNDARKGFKVKEMFRRAPGVNINYHALIEVPQKETKLNGQIAINKSEETEDLTKENAEGDLKVLSIKRNTEQGGRSKSHSGVLKAHDDGMPSKSDRKGRRRRRGSKGKRGGHQDYNQRPPNKQTGTSQVHPRDSLSLRRKPHFKRKPAHKMAYAEKHASSSSGYLGYTGNGTSRSKRPTTYPEPHAGLLEPLKKKDRFHRNHRRHIEPSRRYHERIHPSYANPSFWYEGVPQANYLQPVQAIDSLLHAGYMKFTAKQNFDAYNGIGKQGYAYRRVNVFPPPTYAPNYTNYASYEGSRSASGYRPSTEAFYHPTGPRY